MKYKLKFCIGILLILSTTAGCKKFLDLNPSDQVSAANLFKNPDGYHNALNGIYQMLADQKLYGCELTWGMNSALAQDYGPYYCGNHEEFLSYSFTNINTSAVIISDVWKNAFHTIANCNKLIASAEQKDSSFFNLRNAEKQMIIGEATAVRALLHFEMLRLFAPSPKLNENARLIPYVDIYPNYVPAYLSTKDVLKRITTDLANAQSMLSQMDTVVNRAILEKRSGTSLIPVGGTHFNFRRNRLNYVGIHGLLAKVYLYAGDFINAKKEAEYVYKEFGPYGRLPWWQFSEEYEISSSSNKDNMMEKDLIISFYDRDLDKHVKDTRAIDFLNYQLNTDELSQWYPDTERDYRKYLIKSDNSSEKWLCKSRSDPASLIPVLRMSEIFYIYSECLFKEGSQPEALTVLNQVRNARGKLDYFFADNEEDFYVELMAEYRREFITEGQTFFAHKRLNRDIITSTKQIPMDNKVVLPIPDKEKLF